MAEPGTGWEELYGRALALAPKVIPTTLRPRPTADVAGRRVAFFSTAPESAHALFAAHLAEEYGADVVHVSGALADRAALQHRARTGRRGRLPRRAEGGGDRRRRRGGERAWGGGRPRGQRRARRGRPGPGCRAAATRGRRRRHERAQEGREQRPRQRRVAVLEGPDGAGSDRGRPAGGRGVRAGAADRVRSRPARRGLGRPRPAAGARERLSRRRAGPAGGAGSSGASATSRSSTCP